MGNNGVRTHFLCHLVVPLGRTISDDNSNDIPSDKRTASLRTESVRVVSLIESFTFTYPGSQNGQSRPLDCHGNLTVETLITLNVGFRVSSMGKGVDEVSTFWFAPELCPLFPSYLKSHS